MRMSPPAIFPRQPPSRHTRMRPRYTTMVPGDCNTCSFTPGASALIDSPSAHSNGRLTVVPCARMRLVEWSCSVTNMRDLFCDQERGEVYGPISWRFKTRAAATSHQAVSAVAASVGAEYRQPQPWA